MFLQSCHLRRADLQGHERLFGQADAVLSRKGSAQGDGGLEDLPDDLLHPFRFILVARS